MKHGNKIKKFGRFRKQRKAMITNLASSFVLNNKIASSEAKIKTLRPFVEKLVTKAKTNNLSVKKYLYSLLNETAANKLVNEIGPKFISRKGGYTRITKLPRRIGDGSKRAMIEFVE